MRITSQMTTASAVDRMTDLRTAIDAAQNKVTTGKRFERASEDPTAATAVMGNQSELRALAQYRRNVGTAQRRTALEEGVVDRLNDLLTRAKELAVSQATATADATTRRVAKNEANELLNAAVQLANTRDGDDYLFGGVQSGTAPFTIDRSASAFSFTTSTPTGAREVEIGAGQRLFANHDGVQVFGSTTAGALAALQQLATALDVGTQTAVTNALPTLDTAIADVQTIVGELGARGSQLEIAEANIGALSASLTAFTSDLQEVDLEQAITELVGRQTAYQAAMAATSRVMGLTLTDYLR
ncbi:MAG: flagellar hook-associated protein FlgL [Gemmatimonadaceae bacterium]|nr:flagellar hook-associated protein FlgL [Gemmatimonadaceae bacterium]